MICPSCGTHIRDGLLRCPACHADVATTFRMPRLQERWCASCGVQLPWDASACPNCGAPVDSAPAREVREVRPPAEAVEADEHDALEADFDAEATRSMARIESAVPAGPDPYSEETKQEGRSRTRLTLLAAFAAVLVVGGTVLYITHPWDPSAYSTKATEPADTSMAGFPGSVDALSQDSAAQASGMSGDEYTYLLLAEDHAQLQEIEAKLAESEALLRGIGMSGSEEERTAGLDNQTQIAVELSNLIASLDGVNVTSGTYAEDVQNFRTLGNWLRNWSDALTTAWVTSAHLDDATDHEDEILRPLYDSAGDDGTNYYQTLFNQYITDWAPIAPSGE